jgi:hypothetical protein
VNPRAGMDVVGAREPRATAIATLTLIIIIITIITIIIIQFSIYLHFLHNSLTGN